MYYFYTPQGFELGVFVRVGGNALHSHASIITCTKASEVWAMIGYG